MRHTHIAAWLAAAGIVLCASAQAGAPPVDVIVGFNDDVAKSQRDDWVRARGAAVMHEFHTGNAAWIRLPAADAGDVKSWLADPRVAHVETQVPGIPDLVPDDPDYPLQPHLRNYIYPDADLQAEPAWDLRHDATGVKVAVIDDGFLLTHPDLAANLVPGWDCGDNDSDPSPDAGGTYYTHGTAVAGLIAAIGDNGLGVAGVCWDVDVMPLKHHRDGSPYYSGSVATAAAVDRAVAAGVDVIVCAFHYPAAGLDVSPTSQFYRSFKAASDAGIVIVASAGNDALDLDIPVNARYPASFEFANVVTVACVNIDGIVQPRASAHGDQTVEIAAPGFPVQTTWVSESRGPDYRTISGTSAAAALVGGVVAMIKAHHASVPYPEGALALLYERAEATPDNAPYVIGGRRLNLYRALAEPDLVPPGAVTDLAVTLWTDTSVAFRWTEPGEDGATGLLDHFALDYRIGDSPLTPILAVPAPGGPGAVHDAMIVGLPAGVSVQVIVTAIDEYRNRTAATLVVDLPRPHVTTDVTSAFFMIHSGARRDSTVLFRNTGDWEGVLTAQQLSGGDWLELPAEPLPVPPGEIAAMPYACDASGLSPGFYTAQFGVLGAQATPITISMLVLAASAVDDDPPGAGVPVWESWPNPLNPRATIRFTLPETDVAELRFFDLRGALVRSIPLGTRGPGLHVAQWDGADDAGRALPSGAYFCRLVQSGRQVYPALKLHLVR